MLRNLSNKPTQAGLLLMPVFLASACSEGDSTETTTDDAGALDDSGSTTDDGLPPIPPVERTTDEIELVDELTQDVFGGRFDFDHYRNSAYECGLSGNYTFTVVNPIGGDEATEAPLWVYLHGGGSGYFDENGDYFGVNNQTQDTWNHEETFEDMLDMLAARMLDDSNQREDVTLTRRVLEGYRLVAVAMCDHDLYSGLGTPYLNNPNPGAEVNGMQATMAAVDYTVANYPTTHVFAHGTSAGSIGVFNLSGAYAQEGTFLTGTVSDFYLGERGLPLLAQFAGESPYQPGYDPEIMTEKIGWFGDLDNKVDFRQRVAGGFDDVPVLFLGGKLDPFCIGHQPPVQEALDEGFDNNCTYVYADLVKAVADQPNTPHQVFMIDDFGHVPSNHETTANDVVDVFIGDLLAGNPPHPFGG